MAVVSVPPPVPTLPCSFVPNGDRISPWPYAKNVRVSVQADLHPFLRDIIINAGKEWATYLISPQTFPGTGKQGLYITIVNPGEAADVNISVGGKGPQGQLTVTSGNKATISGTVDVDLGWKSGNGKIGKAPIWTHQVLDHRAKHAWAHILGLPHNSNADFNDHMLNWENIRPLHKMYPFAPSVFHLTTSTASMPGFVSNSWTNQRSFSRRIATGNLAARPITAINLADIGTNGNYIAETFFMNFGNDGYDLGIGAFESNVHLFTISVNVLSFHPADTRIRTGIYDTADMNKGGDRNRATPGESYQKRINFDTPFEMGSQVAVRVWIYRFKVGKGNWIRLNVNAANIDADGFTIYVNTWADTNAYTIGACWLAHRIDDPTIRSGRYSPPEHGDGWVMEDRARLNFSPSPFTSRPSAVFQGLSHVNVRGGVNARFESQVLDYDQNGLNVRVGTWHEENKYHAMGSSYVAFL